MASPTSPSTGIGWGIVGDFTLNFAPEAGNLLIIVVRTWPHVLIESTIALKTMLFCSKPISSLSNSQVIGASEASPFLVCNVEILSVCVSVCLSWTGTILAFVTRDPYPFNFADELGVSNFAELARRPTQCSEHSTS